MKVITHILVMLLLFSSTAMNILAVTYQPFEDEKKILEKIESEKSPSAINIWQLSRIRLQHAAELYKNWEQSKDAADYQKALVYAQSATELSPDWDEAWLLLGMIYAEMKADRSAMEKASDALVNAVDVNPANGRAQLLLAQVLMEQGRYWSAIEHFKLLIEKSEAMRTGTVLSQLTFCYIADGRIQAGIDYLVKDAQKDIEDKNSSDVAWSEWRLIHQAILIKAAGDTQKAIALLNSNFNVRGEAPVTGTDNPRYRHYQYLLSRWEKEG